MASDEQIIGQIRRSITATEMQGDDVRTAATELLSLPTTDVARMLFDVLNSAPQSVATANVLALFKELSSREPRWVSILDKSTKSRRGRCPKKLRSQFRSILSKEEHIAGHANSYADVLAAEVFSDFETITERKTVRRGEGAPNVKYELKSSFLGKRSARLYVTRDLTDIRRMEDLANVLAQLTEPLDQLILDFTGVEHVYVVGLAAIKAWCTAAGLKPRIENASQSTERYLDMVGFDEAGSINKVVAAEGLNLLSIEPLLHANPEDVASRLVRIIDHHMPLSKQARSGLLISFAELVENVHRHAGTIPSAFACAQVYPAKLKITLCIVDTGMGIQASIADGANRRLAERVQDGELAVKLATLPLVTSKPGRHSGYGLYVVSELAVRNGGTFRIFSGNEILTLYRKGWRRKEYEAIVPAAWTGTWIAILLDLNSLLPIGEVYSTLPPAEGAEVEDFFT